MNRIELLNKLSLVKPSLASNDLIPVLTCLWFKGNEILAYNDKISISTKCKTEFIGAIPGNTILGLLKSSRAKDVEFVQENEDTLLVKAASSRMRLGVLAIGEIFEMPKATNKVLSVDMKPFLAGIKDCLRSVSEDTSRPDHLGVTLIPHDVGILLFSTNGNTVSNAFVDKNTDKNGVDLKDRIILSTDFCKQMLALADDKSRLEINDGYALFSTQEATLFGKLIESEKPLEFEQLMDKHFPSSHIKKLVPLPSNLKFMLERAIIMLDSVEADAKTLATIRDGKLKLLSKSGKGEVTDTVKIDDKHPEVSVKLNPKMMKIGCEAELDHMLITNDAMVMSNKSGSSIYLIAATSE